MEILLELDISCFLQSSPINFRSFSTSLLLASFRSFSTLSRNELLYCFCEYNILLLTVCLFSFISRMPKKMTFNTSMSEN